jgi:hypothetical protein
MLIIKFLISGFYVRKNVQYYRKVQSLSHFMKKNKMTFYFSEIQCIRKKLKIQILIFLMETEKMCLTTIENNLLLN